MCCLTGQYHSAKKGWYSWLYSRAGTIKTNQNNFFFVTTTFSILKLWSNFILGLNFFIFFCLKLIFIHYHTQKPTYLGRNQPRLFWRLPPTVNSPNNPTSGRRNISSKQDPRVALCCSLVFIKKKIEKKSEKL